MTAAAMALEPGVRVDGLRIDSVLGSGAFGITYRVTDEVIGANLVLKEYLPTNLAIRDPSGQVGPRDASGTAAFKRGLDQFLREGRIVAPLDHPNIVRVFRYFEANGTAYMLMPYYRGELLYRMLKRSGEFDAAELSALALPLLDALDYLHRRGIIHQDIKPANIWITEEGEPILLDFGAAAIPRQESKSGVTRLGSPGYAAPEQGGAGGAIGPWTDIYCLAATLYRLVTGKVPPDAIKRFEAQRDGADDPLLSLGQASVHPQRHAVAAAIDNALQLAPQKRPSSIGDWRPAFQGRISDTAHAVHDGDAEKPSRLPMFLLGLFVVAISVAALFLAFGDRLQTTSPGETVLETTPDPAPGEPVTLETEVEKARWREALEADTLYAYRRFLEDFPGSIHTTQARERINSLDERTWRETEQADTLDAYRAYLADYPQGLHESQASIRIDTLERLADEAERERIQQAEQDRLAWADARTRRTLPAVDAYLSSWPGGQFVSEARDLRRQLSGEINDDLAYEAARNLGTIAAYEAYAQAFPQGRNVAAALQAVDDLTLRPGKRFRDCDTCPEMIVLPAGAYWQGSPDDSALALGNEKPRRRVTIAEPFAIGVYEVTLSQWDRCVGGGGCMHRPRDNGWGRGDRPAIMISWNDALEYVDWIRAQTGEDYRLPSESEWEYAARAGEESDWPGSDSTKVCAYGNIAGAEAGFRWAHGDCSDPAAIQTLPVGSLQANEFGIHDMIGNVAEWTLDCMTLSYLDAPTDGSPWSMGMCGSRMTRGGSWFMGARESRLPARFNLKAGDRNDFTGLRLVRRLRP